MARAIRRADLGCGGEQFFLRDIIRGSSRHSGPGRASRRETGIPSTPAGQHRLSQCADGPAARRVAGKAGMPCTPARLGRAVLDRNWRADGRPRVRRRLLVAQRARTGSIPRGHGQLDSGWPGLLPGGGSTPCIGFIDWRMSVGQRQERRQLLFAPARRGGADDDAQRAGLAVRGRIPGELGNIPECLGAIRAAPCVSVAAGTALVGV